MSGSITVRSDRKRALTRSELLARRIHRMTMRSTYWARPLPDSLIIGAGKAGSTSLHDYLVQHPQVRGATRKELYFFDVYYDRGPRWYRGQFPVARRGTRNLEATPNYLSDPRVPGRVAPLIPTAKFVVLLRDPAERAESHWNHLHRDGREARSMEQIVSDELTWPDPPSHQSDQEMTAWLRTHVLYHGFYALHLRRWFSLFDRSQFLVLFSETELFADPASATVKVQEFLGLDPAPPRDLDARNQRPSDRPAADAARLDQLREVYRDHDIALEDLLGQRLPWR